jgi:signal recognition particle subunit SRP54
MFEALSDRLIEIFNRLDGRGRLTEKDAETALKEIRMALLEADVNYKVAKQFVERVRERAMGTEILQSLSPSQHVIKIVNEELTAILGDSRRNLEPHASPPSPILLVGLQGSGKTTSAAKLALHFNRQEQRTLLIATDLRRPAAIDQLVILGNQINIPTYSESVDGSAVSVASNGMKKAKELRAMWAIVDTGGRMQIDQELMVELKEIKEAIRPAEVLLVVDAMTGQEAVNVAQEFHKWIGLTGLILTKMDGDARGGAALSITQVTGIPVKFVGVGEKNDALEAFYPDRMASRILGMGDVLSLIEKAQEDVTQEQSKVLERKIRKAQFTLEDFLHQIQQLRRMGPLQNVLEMLPGFNALRKQLPSGGIAESNLKKIEAMIQSMTPQERRHPEVIGGNRRKRIARGSGTAPVDVNQLLSQFRKTQKLMKQLVSGKKGNIMKMMGSGFR